MPSETNRPGGSRTDRKRSGKDPDLTTLTLSISIEDKCTLKMIAAKRNDTVAGVVREWIAEHRDEA